MYYGLCLIRQNSDFLLYCDITINSDYNNVALFIHKIYET